MRGRLGGVFLGRLGFGGEVVPHFDDLGAEFGGEALVGLLGLFGGVGIDRLADADAQGMEALEAFAARPDVSGIRIARRGRWGC